MENFRLPSKFFRIFSYEAEVVSENQRLQKQLELVEAQLVQNVTSNFDEFQSVFGSFASMNSDFEHIRNQTALSKQTLADLREDQVQGMLRLYALQRRKMNTAKARERLQHLAVIKQTLPVLENLIEAAGNFEVALDLIQRAQDLIDKNLKGVKVCDLFSKKLDELKFKCTQKLETECLHQVD
jgi:hypothetical protein